MLLKKKGKIILLLLLSLSAGIFVSCGKDDTPVPVIIDPDPDPDPDPVGFLGEVDYIKTFGGSNEDDAVSMVIANDGDYMVLGSTKSNDGDITDKTGNDFDFWLLKLTPAGEKVWSKTYGGSEDEEASSITKTSDGGYILSGYSRSIDGDVSENAGFLDFWIVKISSSGDIQWERSFGFPGSDRAYNVFETSDGNFFATGFFDVGACGPDPCPGNDLSGNQSGDTRSSRHGAGEFWGILLDSSGNKIWRRYFGGTNNDRSYSALQTSNGGFLMVGSSESVDFDIVDHKGSYDLWAVRLDADGNKLWTKTFGGTEIDGGWSVTKTTDGNYIIVGDARSSDMDVSTSYGGGDLWAVKFNDSGNMIWNKSYGGTEFESCRDIRPLRDGGYVISGFSRSADGDLTSNKGQNDLWVLTINEAGELTFQISIGGSALDFGYSGTQTADDKIVVVGSTESDDFDIPSNRGISDLLLLKLK
jgi:hypothetical protein